MEQLCEDIVRLQAHQPIQAYCTTLDALYLLLYLSAAAVAVTIVVIATNTTTAFATADSIRHCSLLAVLHNLLSQETRLDPLDENENKKDDA